MSYPGQKEFDGIGTYLVLLCFTLFLLILIQPEVWLELWARLIGER